MSTVWTTIHEPQSAPTTPGVYKYMKKRTPLYIGKSNNLRARLKSHLQNAKLDAKEKAIWDNADHIEYTVVDSDFLALILEAQLIKNYQPLYNVISKDDKSYLYISINLGDIFPKPHLVRGRDLVETKKIQNFGPFPSTETAELVLKAIRRLIPFCQQKNLGRRGCFYSSLGLCSPCPSTINTLEEPQRSKLKRKYRKQIFELIRVLNGQTTPVLDSYTRKMHKLAEHERFEEALIIRHKIEKFQYWIDNHSFGGTKTLSLHQSENRLKSLESLLNPYFSVHPYSRIECYDASTLLFQFSCVSMVVLTEGEIDKSQYRRFQIKNPRANSDFSMLKEALTRRFKNPWPLPNILVIDGGKPQVRMAQRVLDQLDHKIVLIGLAKAPDRLIIPRNKGMKTTWLTLTPPPNHPGFNLLKLLRDESHRFANNYRKVLEKRKKQL